MLIILLLFFIVFPRSIFAAPAVSIVDFPETIIAGNIFQVTFSIISAVPGSSYHYKIVGDGNTEILTQPNTACAGNYELCESISIATESANIATASAKFNPVSGTYNLKIRIAQSDKHTSTYNSDIVSVASILPTPTPTIAPTNTPIPTNTPAPTNTPTPSPTKTPTLTPSPTLTLTPSPTETIIPTPVQTSTIILDSTDSTNQTTKIENLNPTESVLGVSNKTNQKKFIPLIFICLGALFLLTPLIIAKIKHET